MSYSTEEKLLRALVRLRCGLRRLPKGARIRLRGSDETNGPDGYRGIVSYEFHVPKPLLGVNGKPRRGKR